MLWAIQVSKMDNLMKGHLWHRYLFNTTELYRAVQPHTAIPRLVKAPLRPQTARTDRHCTWQKQPTQDFDCEI